MPGDPRAVGGAWRRFQRHEFPAPAPDLATVVSHYWVVEWEYPQPYRQLVVPYPNVHLTWRDGAAPQVHGVSSRFVVRVLEGRGRVVGVAFRPGGLRPFLGSPVSALTDRSVPASEVPGLRGPALAAARDVAAVEGWLRVRRPAPDPTAELVAGIVELVAAEPGITRVDDLAARCGSSVRGLQRLFAEYVGVPPKWVIRRYRLHEVTERMARGATPAAAAIDWAGLAAELGYADQAHLVRDFTSMFGEPPTHYARRY